MASGGCRASGRLAWIELRNTLSEAHQGKRRTGAGNMNIGIVHVAAFVKGSFLCQRWKKTLALRADHECLIRQFRAPELVPYDETLIAYFPLVWGMVMCQLLRFGKTIYFYGDVNPVTDLVTNTSWKYF